MENKQLETEEIVIEDIEALEEIVCPGNGGGFCCC